MPGCAPEAAEETKGTTVVRRKVCLVGEQAVGKTSLIRRFTTGVFIDGYVRTLGASVTKKVVALNPSGGPRIRVELIILDIMGNHRFLDLFRDAYFGGAAGVLGAFDLTRPTTLRDLVPWIKGVRDSLGEVPILGLANKADLEGEIAVRDAEVSETLDSLDLPMLWTSARTGENVEKAFLSLTEKMLVRSHLWPA